MIAAGGSHVRTGLAGHPRLRGLWTIVLAAGGARRFGGNKLLLRAGREPLVARAARHGILVSGSRCVVVLGSNASLLAMELAGMPVRIVVNRRWREGMAGSLQAGIAALPTSAQAALVTLADQYAVGPDDLAKLAGQWIRKPRAAAAARIDGGPGAPAVLPRSYFWRVMSLQGDRGARSLLRGPGAEVATVEMPTAAFDLDNRQDLQRFQGFRHRIHRANAPAVGQGPRSGLY
jgi:molybdenum cofactor cytidylyltransferase